MDKLSTAVLNWMSICSLFCSEFTDIVLFSIQECVDQEQ